MLVEILIFLCSYGGAWGKIEDELCDGGIIKACTPKEPFPWDFPGTADEMDRLCPMVLDHLTCMQRYTDKCGVDSHVSGEDFKKVESYVRQVCDKDSDIRQDVLEHLQCIKEVVDGTDSLCWNLTLEASNNYEKHYLGLKGIEEIDEEDYYSLYDEKYSCFFSTFHLACFTAETDRICGAGAKAVVLDAQRQVGYAENVCNSDVSEELIELVDAIEIQMEHQVLLKEILSLKAKA